MEKWLRHVDKWKNCQECTLCTQRDKIVLARGVIPADVMFCGEAPGESENVHGLPFWGPAGDKLEEIVTVVRHQVRMRFTESYVNLVACFPTLAKQTDDHRPEKEEIEACSPRLREFAEISQPKLVVCVGDTAKDWARHILQSNECNAWCDIIHPAALLRMPGLQRDGATRHCIMVLYNAIERAIGVTL